MWGNSTLFYLLKSIYLFYLLNLLKKILRKDKCSQNQLRKA